VFIFNTPKSSNFIKLNGVALSIIKVKNIGTTKKE
jgi:hypothetical protein